LKAENKNAEEFPASWLSSHKQKFVAVFFFHPLMTLLRLNRQGRDRPSLKTRILIDLGFSSELFCKVLKKMGDPIWERAEAREHQKGRNRF